MPWLCKNEMVTDRRRLFCAFAVVEPCWFCLSNMDCSLRHCKESSSVTQTYFQTYKWENINEKHFLTLACFCDNSSRSSATLSSATSNGVWPCNFQLKINMMVIQNSMFWSRISEFMSLTPLLRASILHSCSAKIWQASPWPQCAAAWSGVQPS